MGLLYGTSTMESAKANWAAFQKQVRTITGLTPQETMQLCSHLKGQKEMSMWAETEIMGMKEMRELWVKEKPKKEKAEKVEKAEKPKKEKAEKPKKVKGEKAEKVENAEKAEKTEVSEDPVTEPATSVTPEKSEESITSLEFHLAEAKKKVVTATSVAEKEEAAAKKATEKLEEAMKIVTDLTLKAEKATNAATDARALVEACQKEVVVRTEELEKATAAVAAAAAVATTVSESSDSDPIHIRRKKIPKHIKTLVWNKYIGPDNASAECVSCRTMKISNRSFHCGHVIAESKGGDMTINNLRPICDACNGSMGTRSMNEFTKEFFGWTV